MVAYGCWGPGAGFGPLVGVDVSLCDWMLGLRGLRTGATELLCGLAHSTNRLNGGFQNDKFLLAPVSSLSNKLPVVPTNIYVPSGESQLPPASLGGSPSLASGSDSGSFQIIASLMGLEILCVSFKCRFSVSYSHSVLPHTSPTGLQSQIFWRLIFGAQDPCNCDYPPVCGSPTQGYGS